MSSDKNQQPEGLGSRSEEKAHLAWLRMYAAMFEFLACLGGMGYAGWWLDEKRGWAPWGLLGGLMLGTALGVWRLLRESKRLGL